MPDSRQFGSPRADGLGNQPGDTTHCAQCEAMLADALDGTLTPADQAIFDTHMALCGPCSQMLADARRGAAWLEMLRDPRPEPPAALLERILLQTSGHAAVSMHPAIHELPGTAPIFTGQPAMAPGYAATGSFGKVIPFRARFSAFAHRSAFGQIMLQPRLAMTAAMAFFSIALTMDLTGVRLQDVRASSLSPSSLKRDFSSANARAVRYYDSLRVVYELESRVHDLQSSSDSYAPAGTQTAPQGTSPSGTQPGQAVPPNQTPPAQPDRRRPAAKPAPNSGTSRRENLIDTPRLVASNSDYGDTIFNLTQPDISERFATRQDLNQPLPDDQGAQA